MIDVSRQGLERVVRVATMSLAIGTLVVLLVLYFERGFVPGDAFTYLSAGERLNAGHSLYALSPGDRPVLMNPPYWTVPFLSPPFVAVAWRPLAALPAELGVYLWWTGAVACLAIVIGLLARRTPIRASLAVLVLAIPLTYEVGVGNVNAYLLAGAVATWLLARSGRRMPAGLLGAVMVATKLTPLPLLAWIVGVGDRRGLAGSLIGLAACAVVSLVGAGLLAHFEYLAVARATSTTGLSPFSPGGIVRALGFADPLPTLAPLLVMAAATGVSFLLAARRRPTMGYAAAVVSWTLGSPVVNVNTPILLLALLAPVAWPWAAEGRDA